MARDISKAEAHSLPCLSFFISLSFPFEGQRGVKLLDLLLMMFSLQLNPVNWEVVKSWKWATPHRGPAIIFSDVLYIEWVGGLIGWSGKNIQILILYDRYYLPFRFFCVALNLYLFLSASILLYILFSLLFVISVSSQYKFFSVAFFSLLQKFLAYSVCTYMCPYVFSEFYQVFPVYFLFKRFLTNTTGFSGGSDSKETASSAGDLGSTPG